MGFSLAVSLRGKFPCWEPSMGISLAVHFPLGVPRWVAFAKRNQALLYHAKTPEGSADQDNQFLKNK